MKRRGQGLSMNTIIITILVVLVLVVIAVFFTGGMASLINKIKGIVGTSALDVSEARLSCNSWCSQYESTGMFIYADNFCEKEKDIDIDGNGKIDPGEEDKTCLDLNVACSAIDCEE